MKISNFIIAKRYLEEISKLKDVSFFDFDVVVDNTQKGFHNNILYIGECVSLGHTVFNVITKYLKNFELISGVKLCENKQDDLNISLYLSTILRLIFYDRDMLKDSKPDGMICTKLYDNVLLWSILNDLVSPLFGVKINNIDIVKGSHSYIDAAAYLDKDQAVSMTNNKINKEFIFENLDVENQAIRYAMLLLEILKSLNVDRYKIVTTITSNNNIDCLLGISNLYFQDEHKAKYFILNLLQFIGADYHSIFKENVKMAQSGAGAVSPAYPPLQSWNVPLIELALESVRAPDMYTHEVLEKKMNEFWENVEQVKKDKYNSENIPFEVLLRIKSNDLKTDSSYTLQALLSSARVWQ